MACPYYTHVGPLAYNTLETTQADITSHRRKLNTYY